MHQENLYPCLPPPSCADGCGIGVLAHFVRMPCSAAACADAPSLNALRILAQMKQQQGRHRQAIMLVNRALAHKKNEMVSACLRARSGLKGSHRGPPNAKQDLGFLPQNRPSSFHALSLTLHHVGLAFTFGLQCLTL